MYFCIMVSINNLGVEFSARPLFTDISFVINKNDKIALVGKNGAGKSTLLKILAGLQSPTIGGVSKPSEITIGYLPQQMVIADNTTLIDETKKAFSGLLDLKKEIESLTLRLSEIEDYESSEYVKVLERLEYLNERVAIEGADNMEAEVERTLTGLGFKRSDFKRPTSEFSGGWRMRIELAKILLQRPDLLLLDEPTNHLDIEVIEWLENYLSRNNLTILLVTHDRYFLDRVCNKIIEIDRQSIYTYNGNFDYYLRKRAERIEALGSELTKVKNTLRKEQEWMRRQPQARAGKAKYRIDSFYELKERSKINLREDNINLENMDSGYIGSKIFEAKNISKKYGDKVIVENFNYIFARYEKVGIIGSNGVGKSTLIKMLQGIVEPDSGYFDIGSTVRFGYYSQEGIQFDENKKVIDAVTEIADDIILKENIHLSPMQFLNHFLFSPADQQKYIHTLSGGERCRLHLATVLMRKPNFLILDEPTNDLDIITLRILEDYLNNFNGCLIVVSHDRYFLDNITDHLFVLDGTGSIKDFPGNYTEYRQWLSEQEKKVTVPSTALPKTEKQHKKRPEKLSYKERKEFESLSSEIEHLTSEKQELDAIFSSAQTLDNVAELSARYNAICEELDEKELRWLELSERE